MLYGTYAKVNGNVPGCVLQLGVENPTEAVPELSFFSYDRKDGCAFTIPAPDA